MPLILILSSTDQSKVRYTTTSCVAIKLVLGWNARRGLQISGRVVLTGQHQHEMPDGPDTERFAGC